MTKLILLKFNTLNLYTTWSVIIPNESIISNAFRIIYTEVPQNFPVWFFLWYYKETNSLNVNIRLSLGTESYIDQKKCLLKMINYILYINSKGNMVLLKKNVSGLPVYFIGNLVKRRFCMILYGLCHRVMMKSHIYFVQFSLTNWRMNY
jgi:hypothetical protein